MLRRATRANCIVLYCIVVHLHSYLITLKPLCGLAEDAALLVIWSSVRQVMVFVYSNKTCIGGEVREKERAQGECAKVLPQIQEFVDENMIIGKFDNGNLLL